MLQIILLAVSLSWDSFFIGITDGTFRLSGNSRLRLLLLFALCDSSGTAFGLWSANATLRGLATLSGTLSVVVWLLIIYTIVWRVVGHSGRAVRPLVYLAPFVLSCDNFLAGPAAASTGCPPILCIAVVGVVSGLLFFVGALTGGCCHRWFYSRAWSESSDQ
jgi:putative Mn2+ efflux pump MntP